MRLGDILFTTLPAYSQPLRHTFLHLFPEKYRCFLPFSPKNKAAQPVPCRPFYKTTIEKLSTVIDTSVINSRIIETFAVFISQAGDFKNRIRQNQIGV